MNLLLLSCGRRTSLASLFAAALDSRDGQLHVADMNSLAPALYELPHGRCHQLPPVDSADYKNALAAVVTSAQIDAIVPLIDTELLVLAEQHQALAEQGCTAIVSDAELIKIAHDKQRTAEVFGSAGFTVADWWEPCDVGQVPNEPAGRFVVKPRFGSSSADVFLVEHHQIKAALQLVDAPIIQRELLGDEISIDALLDANGRAVHYVPRRRLRTHGGESIQGLTIADDSFRSWICELLAHIGDLGGRGPQTVQAFLTASGPVLTELNPRFAGGFPLSAAAGAHYADWLLDEHQGAEPQSRIGQYEVGLYMTRSISERFVREPRW